MVILGIGGYSHDSAAALVVDGQLAAAVAEERVSRVKHQGGIPHRAAAYCLEEAGITPREVDAVCGYMRPGHRIARRAAYRLSTLPRHPLYASAYLGYEILHNAQYVRGIRGLASGRAAVRFMDHHHAHAASAFLVSPFDEAAILSIDYVGEIASTWAGHGRGNSITRNFHIDYPHSLGVFYSGITDHLGFLRASDEYKVMGLASYGEPEYLDTFREILRVDSTGYRIDLSWLRAHYAAGSRGGYFSEKFIQKFGPARSKDEPITAHHKNIAASAQAVLEEAVLALANRIHQETGQRTLCIAGGVALNCSMNGRLLRESPFDEIWVQPAAGDDGIAIGGAMQHYYETTGADRSFTMDHAHWGPAFGDEAIRSAFENANIPYEKPGDIVAATADRLAAGDIVGWYQGRMEFGPRALGSRSILADPTLPNTQDRINARVKFREDFRPFAPSVIEDRAHEFFDGCASSPFMLFVYRVRPEMRGRIPAVTHVDGTARVQTVRQETHPLYHRLIEAFEKRRGVPLVLNTSFNVMGEPIVHTPADAIRCFESTGIDTLAIGSYLARKPTAER